MARKVKSYVIHITVSDGNVAECRVDYKVKHSSDEELSKANSYTHSITLTNTITQEITAIKNEIKALEGAED